jgi:hypothetical protein
MTAKQTAILCVISAVFSVGLSRYLFPQVQIKTVEVEKQVIHNNIQTITVTKTLPSGEIDSTTTVVDHTQKIETDSKTSTTAVIPPNWLIVGTAQVTGIDLVNPAYGVQVNRRILGPMFINASANTKGVVGLGLGMEF